MLLTSARKKTTIANPEDLDVNEQQKPISFIQLPHSWYIENSEHLITLGLPGILKTVTQTLTSSGSGYQATNWLVMPVALTAPDFSALLWSTLTI